MTHSARFCLQSLLAFASSICSAIDSGIFFAVA
jgi:hypothetical protein